MKNDPARTVDRVEQLGDADLSFEKLSDRFRTFAECMIGKDIFGRKIRKSRTGVQTDLGDIELSLWCRLVHRLIDEHNEQELFRHLEMWVSQKCLWIHDRQGIEAYALELHASRIFDDPLWADYVDFNECYRPEILEHAEVVWVTSETKPEPQKMTRQRMERENTVLFSENTCLKWREYPKAECDEL